MVNFKYYLAIFLYFITSSAYSADATVKDHFKTVIEQSPYSVEVCKDVSTNNNGSAVLGGLIGGLLGSQLGNGDGKTAMAGVGAVTGAIIGSNNSNGTTNRRQCQIETRYEELKRRVYSHSTVTFYTEGSKYTLKFYK